MAALAKSLLGRSYWITAAVAISVAIAWQLKRKYSKKKY